MYPRALLLAVCSLWLAYQSQFSPSFFFDMVRASLSDMDAGLRTAMDREIDRDDSRGWHTAAVQ